MEKMMITALLIGSLCAVSFIKNEVKMVTLASDTEGVYQSTLANTDTIIEPRVSVQKVKPEEMPQPDLLKMNGYKSDVFLVKKENPDGKIQVDTVINFSLDDGMPAALNTTAETTMLANAQRDKLLTEELIKDGLITNPNQFDISISAQTLKVNNKIINNPDLRIKYFTRFVLKGNSYQYKKMGNKPSVLEEPVMPKITVPNTPPNAIPGHCYVYCKNEDGSPNTEWLEIPCLQKMTETFIEEVVNKLKKDGSLASSFSSKTMTKDVYNAVCAYQAKHSLPVGNLNLPTLTHMGIKMP
jgi:hypothetical protein